MSFRFLHSADWHIGKSFGTFDSEQAAVLRQARLDVVARLAEIASDHDIAHVLVAGDVFDDDDPDVALVRALLARLEQFTAITWHLLPGNHDPATLQGAWSTAKGIGLAKNVIVHLSPSPVKIADEVMLLPAPMFTKETGTDPTAWMDEAQTPGEAMRIGLAHGGVIGFETSEDGSGGVISQTRVESARLNYLALGDWHGLKQVGSACWYSGTPEPDQFPSNEPGYALIVEIASPDAQAVVTPVKSNKFAWEIEKLRVAAADDLEALSAKVQQLGASAQSHLFKIILSGDVALAHRAEIEQRLDRLAARVFLLNRNLDDLHVTTTETDLETIGTGELRLIAERIVKRADNAADLAQARIASLALQRLFITTRSVANTDGQDNRSLGQGRQA
ncbi:MAG: metallophosphoesterase family protein [Hyphomicrobiaceae bacterium]